MVIRSFKCCTDGSEDDQLTDQIANVLDAADRIDNIQNEAAALLFDSDEDSEIDFDGFTALLNLILIQIKIITAQNENECF